MKKPALIFLLLLILILPFGLADMLPIGQKYANYCFQISNVNEFNNYTIIAYIKNYAGYSLAEEIREDSCVGFYKFSEPTIYASKESDYYELDLTLNGQLTEEEEKLYFNSNSSLLKSDMKFHNFLVAKNDPLEKIVDVLEIVNISEEEFLLKKLKVIYTYSDGATEEKFYTNQSKMPPRSRRAIFPWWFTKLFYFIIPLMALVIVIFLITKNRK